MDGEYTLRVKIVLEMAHAMEVEDLEFIMSANEVKEQYAHIIPVPDEIMQSGDIELTDKWLEAQMERAIIRYQTNQTADYYDWRTDQEDPDWWKRYEK